MRLQKLAVTAAAFVTAALAQQTAYGQCGGSGWTGPTTCVSGYCCSVQNEWYSQCIPGSCNGGGGGVVTTTTTTTGSTPAATGTFTNPVLWEDLADNDVFRVGDAYYYTASTMHYSPGAPVLRSYDLVNWEYIGHAVPTLSWSTKYDLTGGQRAYVKGIWASTMRYRKSNNLWYWIGCIEFGKTYVYTASSASGPWTQRATINTCYYDAGLLIDDDDTMYVAYGNSQISIAQLSADGFSQVRTQQVYTTPSSIGTLEGSRFYKRNGQYYIFLTRPANGQYILKASSVFGSYAVKEVALNMPSPVSGSGYPHQGSLVDTASGSWYYMAFIDAYPGGRVPVLAPVTWGSDGYPTITTVNGGWSSSYPYPAARRDVTPTTGTDRFTSSSLSHVWEWNHNPDTSKFTLGSGLKLSTATVTVDLYSARNTLTRRIHGGQGTGTLELDFTSMADGDRAGLALLRDSSAWVGIKRDGSSYTVSFVNSITMNSDWTTANTGVTPNSVSISAKKVWLRIQADIRPGGTKNAQFYWSTDGSSFTQIGGSFAMKTEWQFFMGYRYGIFNYATKALGGSVVVNSFTSA